MDKKACTYDDRHLFFSENESRRLAAQLAEQEAKAICMRCPVQVECLDYAFQGDMWGIWGGTTRVERDKMRKRSATTRVRVDPPRSPGSLP